MMRFPYTGSRVFTLALALNKPVAKRIPWWHQLPTPALKEFERPNEPLSGDLKFPLFVKPSRERTSMGIRARSIVNTEDEMREQVAFIIEK